MFGQEILELRKWCCRRCLRIASLDACLAPKAEGTGIMAWILIIDDDALYRGVLRRILESRGHVVLEAMDGSEGLEIFNENRPDVVITDMIMAGMSGEDVIQALRRSDHPAGIIAVSGDGAFYNVDAVNIARRLGAHAILRKLDPMERILSEVDRVLQPTSTG